MHLTWNQLFSLIYLLTYSCGAGIKLEVQNMPDNILLLRHIPRSCSFRDRVSLKGLGKPWTFYQGWCSCFCLRTGAIGKALMAQPQNCYVCLRHMVGIGTVLAIFNFFHWEWKCSVTSQKLREITYSVAMFKLQNFCPLFNKLSFHIHELL